MCRVGARHTTPHSSRSERPEFTNIALAYRFEPRRFWMFGPIAGRPPNDVPRDQVFLSTLGSYGSSVGSGLHAVPDSALNVAVLIETAYRNYGVAWSTRM